MTDPPFLNDVSLAGRDVGRVVGAVQEGAVDGTFGDDRKRPAVFVQMRDDEAVVRHRRLQPFRELRQVLVRGKPLVAPSSERRECGNEIGLSGNHLP